MKSRLIFVFLSLFVAIQGKSQVPSQFLTIESPNSASLKGALMSPVSLNTGKTGVSIPIYTIKQKDIEVPIVLSYGSGGVKVDVHPGWVGSNWSLSTGGVITRNIKGVPDELYWKNDYVITDSKNTSGSQTLPIGYAWNYSINAASNWNTSQKITDLAKSGSNPSTLWVEAEPDEYIFECGGYSGKFYMDHTGDIRVQAHPDIKVEGYIVFNVPLFNSSKSLDANDPDSFTSVNVITYSNGYPIYSFNRIRKAVLMGFKITTPDGLQYEYGMWGKEYDKTDTFDEVEFSADMFGQFYFDDIFTTWQLKKITAPDNQFVEFFYERGDPVLQMGDSFSFYKAGGSAPAKGFLGFIFGGPSSYTQEAKRELNGRFVRPTYLKKIISNDAVIEFQRSETTELKYDFERVAWQILDRSRFYDKNYFCPLFNRMMLGIVYPNDDNYVPGVISYGNNEYSIIRHDGMIEDLYFNRLKWYQLDNITVSSRRTDELIKKWSFKYSNVSSERLQLLSLQEIGRNESALPPYEFKYDRSKVLPIYNSFLIDHWGYYNGRLAQVDISNEATLIEYKNLREPVEDFLYAGSLIKVITPTNGTKYFSYEPNTYTSVVKRNALTGAFNLESLGTSKIGGGLRIREIVERFGDGTPDVTTTYKYDNGILLGDIQYYWPDYKGRLLNGNEYSSTRFVTESLLPVSENPGGGVVAYERVTKEQEGIGKTVYQYSGFVTNPDEAGVSIDPEKSPYSPFVSRSFERGLLRSVETFHDINNVLPLTSEVYEYESNSGFSNDFIRAVEARGHTLFGASEINEIQGTSYKHYLHPYQLIRKTSKTLNVATGNYLTTVEEYEYDTDPVPNNDNQLKEVRVTNSSGETLRTRYKHPLDFQVNSVEPALTGLNTLKSGYIFNRMILKERAIKPAGQTQYFITSYSLNTYNKSSSGFPHLKEIYNLEVNTPATTNSTVIMGSTFYLDPQMSISATFKYDDFGNIQQFIGKDGIPITILYGYDHAYPVAQIKNASYVDVLNVLGQSTIDQLNSNPGTDAQLRAMLQPLRTNVLLKQSEVTTYTYDPLIGLTSQTDKNGVTTYYEYDDFQRLQAIKDQEEDIVKELDYYYKVR